MYYSYRRKLFFPDFPVGIFWLRWNTSEKTLTKRAVYLVVEPTVGIVHGVLNRFSPNSNHASLLRLLSPVFPTMIKVQKHNHHDATVD